MKPELPAMSECCRAPYVHFQHAKALLVAFTAPKVLLVTTLISISPVGHVFFPLANKKRKKRGGKKIWNTKSENGASGGA